MISFLLRIIITAAALFFIAGASQGTIQVNGAAAAIIAALVLGLANAIVKPILMFITGTLTMPLSCITLGLWSLVLSWLLNAALFWGVGELLQGFEVKGFWPAMLGALAMSVVNSVASALVPDKKREVRR
ncbi:MAG TPA: phage holin family protein [Abditibacterium sp.]|jgi:putative membrane protein